MPILAMDLGLPPSVVLVTKHGEQIAFGKAQLLRNDCIISVQCACYKTSRWSWFNIALLS